MKIDNSICFDYSHKNQLTIESPSYAGFTQFLFGSSFQLGKIQAGFSSLEKLEKYSIIVIGGPRESNFTDDEIANIVQFVKNGGSLLIINDEGGDYGSNCNVSQLTKYFGFVYEPDILFDSVNFQTLQNRVVITEFEHHPICEHLDAIVQSSACSIQIIEELDVEENINVFSLAKTGLNCYRTKWDGKKWMEDLDSPRSNVAVGVNFYKGRVIGLSTVSIFSSLSSSYGYYARSNQDFVANVFNWLLDTSTPGEEKFQDFKWLSIPVKINLYLWMEELVGTLKEWGNIEVIVNFALKYLKKNYQEILKKESQRIEELRKKHYEASLPQASLDGEVNPLNPINEITTDFGDVFERTEGSDEDLLDIMNTLKTITSGKVGGDFNLEEFKREEKERRANKFGDQDKQGKKDRKNENYLDITDLDLSDDENLRKQLESKKIVSGNLGSDNLDTKPDLVDEEEALSDPDNVSKEEIKARADAALDAAFESLDSFEEFQNKLKEIKKLSDLDDDIDVNKNN